MINDIYFDHFPTLESERLIFRKQTLDDAVHLQYLRNNDQVMEFMDAEMHKTIEISEKFITENLEIYSKKEGMFWAIIEKKSNEYIGDFAFWKITREHHRAEIGYTLKPHYWGKGYMKETMLTIIDFGFNKLNLHSLEANINPKNNNSRKILTSVGFKKEAYFKESYYYNGNFIDSEIYSLLKSDWK